MATRHRLASWRPGKRSPPSASGGGCRSRPTVSSSPPERRRASSWRSPRWPKRATKSWSRCRPIHCTRPCSPKLAHARCSIAPIPIAAGCPIVEHVRSLITPATRALVVIDPNNPTGATYPAEIRRALVELADRHNFPLLADEVYADLAFDGPVPAHCRRLSRRAGDLVLVAVEGVSGARLARRAGWPSATRRAWTTCWRRSRSSRTAGCARPGRWSTRSPRRSTATGRTRQRFAPRCRRGPS